MGCGLGSAKQDEVVEVTKKSKVEITVPDVARKIHEASATGDAPPMVVKDPQFPGGTRIVPRINDSPSASSSIHIRRSKSNLESQRGSSKTPPATPTGGDRGQPASRTGSLSSTARIPSKETSPSNASLQIEARKSADGSPKLNGATPSPTNQEARQNLLKAQAARPTDAPAAQP
mmetsp:Transcript_43832/g.80047  ORF Transcript_43832/g.80047 Transcript_43832/m.80047 type:complete len:175 (+) Transcript_43832:96-620(+)